MKIIDLAKERPAIPTEGISIALGNFDGFHNGHRELIRRTVQEEHENGHRSSVLLFKNHTSEIVPQEKEGYLSSLPDKLERLEALGISCVFLLTFDRALMGMTHEHFLQSLLIESLGARHIVVGEDYTFGKRALGTVRYLQEQRERFGYHLSVIPDVNYQGQRISSTRIRRCIAAGGIEIANCMLGYPYILRGTVVSGADRGKKLGFPTANLALSFPYCLPIDGVYLTRVLLSDGKKYFGLTNVGTNPTFAKKGPIKVETYLLDFNDDLYGQEIRLQFLRFERRDITFPNKEALIAQMRSDEQILRSWVSIYEQLGE